MSPVRSAALGIDKDLCLSSHRIYLGTLRATNTSLSLLANAHTRRNLGAAHDSLALTALRQMSMLCIQCGTAMLALHVPVQLDRVWQLFVIPCTQYAAVWPHTVTISTQTPHMLVRACMRAQGCCQRVGPVHRNWIGRPLLSCTRSSLRDWGGAPV